MPHRKIADIALLAGKIMLESNAETYRVEETMEYILKITQFETTEAFVLTTGLMITLDDPSIEAITLIQRIRYRSVNLNNIHHVNNISRQLVAGNISFDDAYNQLRTLSSTQYTPREQNISNLILAIGFTLMLNGNLFEAGITAINTLFSLVIWHLFRHQKDALFLRNLCCCAIIGIISTIGVRLLPDSITLNAIIYGSVMPMVPGTLITNAIRDTFKGDYTSGVARTLEALIVGLSIAGGITIGVILSGGGAYIL
ncbi:threonine/serine exporter family protein [Carnobacteriaceae bacterium zg-C25]|nr:threonine/serine exporter family protein [Carnobacteriaceae bacterium zg-C25]